MLKLAQAMLYLGGILTAVGIGSQIGKIVTALQGLAAFIEGHAVAFGVGSVLGGIAATVHDWKAMTEARERTFADLTSRGDPAGPVLRAPDGGRPAEAGDDGTSRSGN